MYELKQVISTDSVIEDPDTLKLLAAGWEPFAIFTRRVPRPDTHSYLNITDFVEVLVLKRIVEPQRVIAPAPSKEEIEHLLKWRGDSQDPIPKPTPAQQAVVIPNTQREW